MPIPENEIPEEVIVTVPDYLLSLEGIKRKRIIQAGKSNDGFWENKGCDFQEKLQKKQ